MSNYSAISKEDFEKYSSELQNFLSVYANIEKSYNDLKEQFKRLNSDYSELVDFMPLALWVMDEQMQILRENNDAKKLRALLKNVILGSGEKEVEFEQKTYMIKQFKTQNNHYVIRAIDLTKQKQKQRLANMGQTMAHIAHEIRNPIGGALLMLNSLDNGHLDDAIQETLLDVSKAIHRVNRIINTSLLYSRAITLNKTHFSFKALQNDILEAMKLYEYEKDIKIEFDLKDGKIFADFELLGLVFSNLLYNAIDAIEESEESCCGQIKISAEQNLVYTVFYIQDDGEPLQDASMIFEDFKSTKTKGNGLGLALSQRIIQAHEGEIKLTDEKNKIFMVRIPN